MTSKTTPSPVLNSGQLLEHWQGHRALTRRVIEAFPEEAFFNHRIGGMRTFSDMCKELIAIAGPGMKEIAGGPVKSLNEDLDLGTEKKNFLEAWDETTEIINREWKKVSEDRFQEVIVNFGLYEAPVWAAVLYYIDNEIHHRGQAYVYLRDLGIEPPNFWER